MLPTEIDPAAISDRDRERQRCRSIDAPGPASSPVSPALRKDGKRAKHDGVSGRRRKGFGMSTKSGTETFDDLVTATLPSLVTEVTTQGGRLYRSIMARVEQPLLRHALELCGGNQLKAAKLLGINSRTIYRKLKDDGEGPAPEREDGADL